MGLTVRRTKTQLLLLLDKQKHSLTLPAIQHIYLLAFTEFRESTKGHWYVLIQTHQWNTKKLKTSKAQRRTEISRNIFLYSDSEVSLVFDL